MFWLAVGRLGTVRSRIVIARVPRNIRCALWRSIRDRGLRREGFGIRIGSWWLIRFYL